MLDEDEGEGGEAETPCPLFTAKLGPAADLCRWPKEKAVGLLPDSCSSSAAGALPCSQRQLQLAQTTAIVG